MPQNMDNDPGPTDESIAVHDQQVLKEWTTTIPQTVVGGDMHESIGMNLLYP